MCEKGRSQNAHKSDPTVCWLQELYHCRKCFATICEQSDHNFKSVSVVECTVNNNSSKSLLVLINHLLICIWCKWPRPHLHQWNITELSLTIPDSSLHVSAAPLEKRRLACFSSQFVNAVENVFSQVTCYNGSASSQ